MLLCLDNCFSFGYEWLFLGFEERRGCSFGSGCSVPNLMVSFWREFLLSDVRGTCRSLIEVFFAESILSCLSLSSLGLLCDWVLGILRSRTYGLNLLSF